MTPPYYVVSSNLTRAHRGVPVVNLANAIDDALLTSQTSTIPLQVMDSVGEIICLVHKGIVYPKGEE